MYNKLLILINNNLKVDYNTAIINIEEYLNTCSDFIDILYNIGIIPESIKHDSRAEKLYSKTSDIVLSIALNKIGLKAKTISQRGDNADVIVSSIYHDYTLVSDAKTFRLSRTAKNQKDFKVTSLSNWRDNCTYALLVSPYYQYPKNVSQIYKQALDYNVCLFSWEHLIYLLENGIKESEKINLSNIWNFSEEYSSICLVKDMKYNFFNYFNQFLKKHFKKDINNLLSKSIDMINLRSCQEIEFINTSIKNIKNYSKDEAINALLNEMKLENRINQIRKFVNGLNDD